MSQENESIVTMMPVIDLSKCYLRMVEKNYLNDFDNISYGQFIFGILGGPPDDYYTLYEFRTPVIEPTKIDTTDIRDVFEDFLSWELNISPNQKNGSPTEILLKI